MLDEDRSPDHPQAPHDFCSADTAERLAAWQRVLDLQVELFGPVEWAVLASLPCWAEARSVLDVGCGNGSYLAALSRRAPDRRYVGLEPSPGFAAAARARASRLAIVEADFFGYAPPVRFDLVLMRFVVQHLEDWDAVLDQACRLLTRQGSLLIVEPDVAGFANAPALPLFTAMLGAYGAAAQSRGRLRASLDDLAARATERGWLHVAEARRTVVHEGARAAARVLDLYRGWTELCRRCGYVPADYAAVERELVAWQRCARVRSVIGLRFLELRPA